MAYSDSHPTLYVVHGSAKPVLREPNSTEPDLFHHAETGLEAIERLCFLPPPGTGKREARKRNLSIASLPTPLQGWMTV